MKNLQTVIRVLFASVFVGICAAPCIAMPICGNTSENPENVKADVPAAPEFFTDGRPNKNFSDDFEKYFSYILPFRKENITAAARIKSDIFSSGSEKVLIGKDGVLFYKEEAEIYCGASEMSEREICAAAIYLSLLNEYCGENGVNFLFTAAPDKAQIYGNRLPACCPKKNGASDLEKLYGMLDALNVKYCDLTPVLSENDGYYLKTDTHWNDLGALTAWNEIMNCMGTPHKDYSGAEFSLSKEITGDLAEMLYPNRPPKEKQYAVNAELSPDLKFIRPSAINGDTSFDTIMNDITGNTEKHDFIIETRCPSASGGSAVIRRDSFGRAMLPYFADNYKRAYLTRGMTVTEGELAGADDFIYEIAERNIKLITSEGCYIPSPPRILPETAEAAEGAVLEICADYGMPRVSGSLPSDSISDNGRIFVVVSDGENEYTAEAYPIGENGFCAYLNITETNIDLGGVLVMTDNGNGG